MYMEYDEMLEGQVREAVERLSQIWEDLDDLKQKVQDDLLLLFASRSFVLWAM